MIQWPKLVMRKNSVELATDVKHANFAAFYGEELFFAGLDVADGCNNVACHYRPYSALALSRKIIARCFSFRLFLNV